MYNISKGGILVNTKEIINIMILI